MRERDIIGSVGLVAAMFTLVVPTWEAVAIAAIALGGYLWTRYSDDHKADESALSRLSSLENEVKALKSALALKR